MKKLSILILALTLSGSAIADKLKCNAKTQSGVQCSRAAQANDTKCFQHSDKAIRCGAVTKAGTPCKVVVKLAGAKCHNHLVK